MLPPPTWNFSPDKYRGIGGNRERILYTLFKHLGNVRLLVFGRENECSTKTDQKVRHYLCYKHRSFSKSLQHLIHI